MSGLHDERLVGIEPFRVASRYPRRIGRNARILDHGTGITDSAAILRTESGATGWGLVATERLPHDLIGRRIGDLFDPETGVVDEAALPLDVALHDLAGVLLGVPVHELLGGAGPARVPCYDGAIYQDDLDRPELGVDAVLACCIDDWARGFRAFKLKIGRGFQWLDAEAGRQRDVDVTRAVRDRFPDCTILVDANDGYTADGFAAYVDAVADCGLYWIEEPFPENEPDLLALRATLAAAGARALVADGESPIAAGDDQASVERRILELAAKGLVDVVLFDVMDYGITPWRRLMPRLADLGVQASPHAWGSPLKTFYAGQLAAGLGNVPTVEGVPGETDGVDASGYRLENGLLDLPAGPGFALALEGGG